MHNAFTTKINRFAPTAPGSGLVQGPSYITSPDPGYNHKPPSHWHERQYLDKTLKKYKTKVHKNLTVIPNTVANSIPARKLAATAYTGDVRKYDTVGPAAYNPKSQATRKQTPQYEFHQSKVQRTIFKQTNMAHNDMCWASNPGPGVYDYEKPGTKQFNANGENTVFQSKVPNCQKPTKVKQAPGPGTYKTVVSIEKTANDQLRSTSDG